MTILQLASVAVGISLKQDGPNEWVYEFQAGEISCQLALRARTLLNFTSGVGVMTSFTYMLRAQGEPLQYGDCRPEHVVFKAVEKLVALEGRERRERAQHMEELLEAAVARAEHPERGDL